MGLINKSIIFIPVYVLVFILPFLPILSEFFLIRLIGNYTLLGFSKEVISFFFIFLSLIYLIYTRGLFAKVNLMLLLLIIFIFYGMTHLFITETTITNAVNNFRLIFLNVFIAFTIVLIYLNLGINLNPKIIFYLIAISTLIVTILGFYERFLNPDIIHLYKLNFDAIEKNTGIPGFPRVRIVSTLGNPINLGMYMIVGIIAIIFLRECFKLKSNMLFLSSLISFITIIIFTLSRTAYMALLLVLIAYFLSKLKIKSLPFLFFIVILFYALFFLLTSQDNLVLLRVQYMFDIESIQASEPRIERWESILKILSKDIVQIFWGFGLGNSGTSGLDESAIIIENSYISILYELGIIGLILFFTILFFYFKNTIVIIKKAQNKHDKAIGIAIGLYFIAFTSASLFMDAYLNNPFNFYFWLFLALSEITVKRVNHATIRTYNNL